MSPSVGIVVTTSYLYDINDERIAEGANGSTTTYPFPIYNTNGTTTTKHIFANGEDVADVQGSGTSAQVYYIHDDALGGANVLSNASGTVAEVLDYYPFGGIRLNQQATSTFGEQRRFTGHEFDTGTGLNYMDARYEGPMLSRFLSEDPNFIQGGPENWQNPESAEPQYGAVASFVTTPNSVYLASPQNLNPYSYVDENPLKYTDPSGKYVDISASVTIPDIVQPELPGFSFALDLQIDRSGDYSLSAAPGIGWGAYAKPFSVYYVPGPVPNDSVSSTVGADSFALSLSSDNNNGLFINNPAGYGFGAGVDVYLRWPFTLVSNLPKSRQSNTFLPNTTISAYNSPQSRAQSAQTYNASIDNSHGSSAGAYGYSSSGAPLPNPTSRWTTLSGAVVTWSGQLVSAPPSK